MSDTDSVPLSRNKKKGFYYGYVIVAVCFFIMVVMHGAFNSFGVFITPLEAEFNSTRAVLSGANSVAYLIMGIAALVLGILTDRFGPRLVFTISGILFGAGYMLMSQADSILQIYLFMSLAGIGLSASDVIPMSSVVRWFVRKRGTMSGIMKVGTGLGMMTVPLLTSILIDKYNWNTTYLILGITVIVVVVPLSQLLKKDPRELGLLPDGDIATPQRPFSLTEEGLVFRQALKTKQIWMVCVFYAVLVYCGMTALTHVVPYAEGIGIPKTAAASIISVYGFASMFGRITMGLLGDRMGHKKTMVICFIVAALGIAWLQFAGELWMLYLFAVIYGFSHGGFFSVISPMVAGLFGTRSQGSIMGIVIFFGTIGGSIGMLLSGYIYDVTGTYRIAFLIMLGMILSGLAVLSLVKPVVTNSNGR